MTSNKRGRPLDIITNRAATAGVMDRKNETSRSQNFDNDNMSSVFHS